MKRLIILPFFLAFVIVKAQTFKVIKVETSDPTNYERLSRNLLGKIVTVSLNGSLGMKFSDQREFTYLYKTTVANTYELDTDNGKVEEYNTAIIYYKQGVLNSIEVHYSEKNKQLGQASTLTYIVKRM